MNTEYNMSEENLRKAKKLYTEKLEAEKAHVIRCMSLEGKHPLMQNGIKLVNTLEDFSKDSVRSIVDKTKALDLYTEELNNLEVKITFDRMLTTSVSVLIDIKKDKEFFRKSDNYEVDKKVIKDIKTERNELKFKCNIEDDFNFIRDYLKGLSLVISTHNL